MNEFYRQKNYTEATYRKLLTSRFDNHAPTH